MKATDIPSYFPKPFADSAGSGYINPIPTASQIGITDGAASLTDGFPPLTFTPKASGGVPPFGADFNGILNQTTAVARWIQAGGLSVYDATFSTAIGGYPSGAVLVRADGGGFWISTADDNTTDPDTGGAGWTAATITLKDGTHAAIGASPSAWGSSYYAMDIGGTSSILMAADGSTELAYNVYNDGSGWKRKTTGYSTILAVDSGGQLTFNSVGSGAAGASVTFSTPLLTVKADGSMASGKSPASGYTRLTPNFCFRNPPASTTLSTSLTAFASPDAGAKALVIRILAYGATGSVYIFSDSGGATEINSVNVESSSDSNDVDRIVIPASSGGSVWIKTSSSSVTATAVIVGYYD